MLACDAHDTSSELIKMRSDVVFGGQKRTLGGPFGLQSALLFIFLKNFSQCQERNLGECYGFDPRLYSPMMMDAVLPAAS